MIMRDSDGFRRKTAALVKNQKSKSTIFTISFLGVRADLWTRDVVSLWITCVYGSRFLQQQHHQHQHIQQYIGSHAPPHPAPASNACNSYIHTYQVQKACYMSRRSSSTGRTLLNAYCLRFIHFLYGMCFVVYLLLCLLRGMVTDRINIMTGISGRLFFCCWLWLAAPVSNKVSGIMLRCRLPTHRLPRTATFFRRST